MACGSRLLPRGEWYKGEDAGRSLCNDGVVEMPTRHQLISDGLLLEHSTRVDSLRSVLSH